MQIRLRKSLPVWRYEWHQFHARFKECRHKDPCTNKRCLATIDGLFRRDLRIGWELVDGRYLARKSQIFLIQPMLLASATVCNVKTLSSCRSFSMSPPPHKRRTVHHPAYRNPRCIFGGVLWYAFACEEVPTMRVLNLVFAKSFSAGILYISATA